MSGYENRLLSKDDAKNMPSLYRSAFDIKVPAEYVLKKFFHPYQKIRASFVTVYESMPISFYGVIVQKVRFRDTVFYIGQSCDSMTHKQHGGKGYFVTLAERTYTTLKEQGISYVYGFPNTTIYNLRIKKLKWIHSENINYYKDSVKAIPLSKVAKKFSFLRLTYLSYCSKLLRKYSSCASQFDNSNFSEEDGAVIHDSDYYDYKKSNDKFIINIHGVNVWIKIDGFLWVGDIQKAEYELFVKVVSELRVIAKITGCSYVGYHFQENSYNDKMLSKLFAPNSQIPLGFKYLSEETEKFKFKFCGADFDTW